jgi:2,3-bisphosphoglycerate-dependent phosphoglycerate mutase
MSAFLILLRHGQSEYNKKNIFTGWLDIGLSEEGHIEAQKAREALKNYKFNIIFISALKRAQDTAKIIIGDQKPKIIINQALNERSYGELEGKNKDDVRAQYGAEQVKIWRRSLDQRPPGGESLRDTWERVVPYYEREIRPFLNNNNIILIVAHGNSLRALISYLDNLSPSQVLDLEIPTGVPIIYEINDYNISRIN